MANNLYIYAVTRAHMRELSMLTSTTLEQMLAAPDYDAALAILAEKGWETELHEPGAILMAEENKTWDFISEMVEDMSPFNVFLVANDYHNLKAAIKKTITGSEVEPVYLPRGTVPLAQLRHAAETADFSDLPPEMRVAGEAAFDALRTSGDGQLCDIRLDVAALAATYQAGKASGSDILARYGELTVAVADIKTAARCAKLGKPRSFVREALVECETLSADRLALAAGEGPEALYTYLANTDYAEAVPALRKSAAAFECWCDNLMMNSIRSQKTVNSGIGPLAAYLLARECEIKSVRMILSGQLNRLPAAAVRERLREMYV